MPVKTGIQNGRYAIRPYRIFLDSGSRHLTVVRALPGMTSKFSTELPKQEIRRLLKKPLIAKLKL